MTNLFDAYRHSANNQAEVEASTQCGCFQCMEIYSPLEITAWSGGAALTQEELESGSAMTAICPKCGSESVIGDKSGCEITLQFLNLMHGAWFQKTHISRPDAKR